MRLLVVGANGFLGRTVAQMAMQSGLAVDATVHRHREFVPANVNIVRLRDLADVERYDAVIIAGSAIASGGSEISPQVLREANIRLVLEIVDQFTQSHIVFCSSVSVYGVPTSLPLTETSPYWLPTGYGMSKLAGETIVQTASRYTVIRFSSLYGEGMARNTFLPRIIDSAKTGVIKLFGNGDRRQDYLHVSDAARLLLLAAKQQKKGVFLGANGRTISNVAAAKLVCQTFPGAKIICHGVDNSPSFEFDTKYTHDMLNFVPTVAPDQGIVELSRV